MGILTAAAGGSSSSATSGILTASEFGLVSSASVDQTALFQAFINDTTAKLKVIDVQIIKYTTAMTLPAGGTHLMGYGSGGDFATYLVPTNCAAFDLDNVHHSLLENFMIWPKGTTPPASIITVQNGAYSHTLRDIRIHTDSTYVPSVSAILQQSGAQGACQDIVFDRVIVRSDGTYFPVGFKFASGCGECRLDHVDIETCSKLIQWLGGNITVTAPYTERAGVNSVDCDGGIAGSLSIIGGLLQCDASALVLAIRDGASNISVQGTKLVHPTSGYHGYFYGTSGSSNINIMPSNYDPTRWGGSAPASIASVGRDALPKAKFTSINVTTGVLAVGNITGAHFVSLMTTNAVPGNQQCRTAAQMIADHGKGAVDASYILRVTNTGAGTFTLTTNTGVTLTGTMTVAQNTWREFVVTMGASTVTIQSIGVGTYS